METKEKQPMDVYFQTTSSYTVRTEVYDGTDYIVVPVVMMVEGVHHGSHGPILHTAEELGRFPASWDGIPVTLGHPQVDGQYVSANSPEVLKDWAIGRIFNTYMDGSSLKSEAWIDQTKLIALSPETLERINKGEIIEVSIGVFSDEDIIEGFYGVEQYSAIARNHRPNHLALLPDEVGACSILDGCGLRVNKKGGVIMEIIVNETNEQQVLKELSLKGFSVNETGYQERANKAQTMLNNEDDENSYHYLEELYADEMVYVVHSRDEKDNNKRSRKFYKRRYQENAAGEIEFTGEAVQVKRVVDYPSVPVVNADGTVKRVRRSININSKKEDSDMTEKCTPCVKTAVDALIANKATAYVETDREWLEELDESQLEKMNPVVVNVDKKVTKEDVIQVMKGFSMEEHLSTMPEEVREQVQSGLRINKERRNKMVTEILANESNPWSKEELETLAVPTLEKVYITVNKKEVADFTAFASGADPKEEVNSAPIMLPMGVE